MTYNYDSFKSDHYDLVTFRGPRPGMKAPDVMVQQVDGQPHRLLDFDADFLVLEMGSRTCPLFQGRRPGMARAERQMRGGGHSAHVGDVPDTFADAIPVANSGAKTDAKTDAIADRFKGASPDVSADHAAGRETAAPGQVQFAVLYVREAHPGSKMPAHKTMQDKAAAACALRDEDGEDRVVYVDDLDGTAHQAFGGYPNSVFIINRNGCVVYFSDWNMPGATLRALAALRAGKPAAAPAYFRPVPPWVLLRVLRAGGTGAASDFFRGLPSLIWKNVILRSLRLIVRRPEPVMPDRMC